MGREPNTGAIGAVVRFGPQPRWVLAGDSYQSSSDRRALFAERAATTEADAPPAVEVRWPDGGRLRLVDPPRNRYLIVPQADRPPATP